MTTKQLIQKAIEATKLSHSPYSNFKVGAALVCKNGKVYLGANIENSSYPLCMCAERTAIYSAVLAGETQFIKMAVVGDGKSIVYPCGACRQVLSELAPNLEIVCAKNEKVFEKHTISTLLPHSFKL